VVGTGVFVLLVWGGTLLHRAVVRRPDLKTLEWFLLLLVVVFGGFVVRWGALLLGRIVTQRTVVAAGAVVRFVATGLGYVLVLLVALAVLGVSPQRLLVGAGLASVVLGIAAQQSLSNIFASFVLLFTRPFNVGDRIIIRSATLGVLECDVRAIGLTYVTVSTETGLLRIPNAVMSASALGRLPASPVATDGDGA
jgi:small-conductance mechanosensitive channel